MATQLGIRLSDTQNLACDAPQCVDKLRLLLGCGLQYKLVCIVFL